MVVPLLANAFGGRPSVGLLLPILVFADVFAVSWYHRHADWKHILRLIPWALLGIAVATLVGKNLSDTTFSRLLAILVIAGIVIMIWQDLRRKEKKIPEHRQKLWEIFQHLILWPQFHRTHCCPHRLPRQ